MGLYSLNRVAGLTENAYINKSLIESMDDSNNFTETSLLEVSQIITEHENKMFNTLIELDFVSAMNEHTEKKSGEAKAEEENDAPADDKKEAKSEADDAKKKNIFKKAKELLEKVWEAIKNAIRTFFEKVQVLLTNDKKIVEKYIPALEKLSDADLAKYDKEFEYYDDPNGAVPFINDNMFINVKKDNAEEEIKKYSERCNKFKTDKLNGRIIKNAVQTIRGKSFEEAKKNVNKLNASAIKTEGLKDEAYETAVAQSKVAKECAAIYIKTVKKIIADNRKIIVLAGKWALAGTKKDEAVNDAFDFALAEASDVYVAECLEF